MVKNILADKEIIKWAIIPGKYSVHGHAAMKIITGDKNVYFKSEIIFIRMRLYIFSI